MAPGVDIKQYPPHMKPPVLHWVVGQPLGALSSWAVFTLVHHLMVQYAATMASAKSGRTFFSSLEVHASGTTDMLYLGMTR